MSEEKVITLNEFKTVIEGVNSNIKKLSEAVTHRLDKLEGTVQSVKEEVAVLHESVTELRVGQKELQAGQASLLAGQADLLEGQAEIKGVLAQKVDRAEFTRLEKRVVRIERKIA